jgi:hypothetical protein
VKVLKFDQLASEDIRHDPPDDKASVPPRSREQHRRNDLDQHRVWLVTSHAFAPVVATPDSTIEHLQSPQPSARHLYRLSPIPPGADWTS